jgi:hypothetical protein
LVETVCERNAAADINAAADMLDLGFNPQRGRESSRTPGLYWTPKYFRNGGENLRVCHGSSQGIATISEIAFGTHCKLNAPPLK